jgi:general secretion pathway protein G
MKNFFTLKKMPDQKGFTLIELLIVIAIIGILATIATVSLGSSQRRARDGQRKADLKQIQNSLEIYFNNNAAYPNQSGGAISGGTWGSGWPNPCSGGASCYMRTVPSDPLAPAQQYCYSGGGANYALHANMEGPAVSGEPEYNGGPFSCNGVSTYDYRLQNPF